MPPLPLRRLLVPRSLALALRAASALATQLSSGSRCTLEAAYTLLPHPEKAATGGEDACFCGDSVYGVFDGVGGWASKGIDAGAFARQLASSTHAHITRQPRVELEAALTAGLRDVRLQGSCTACLLHIDRRLGVLSGFNVGDSGWRVRRGRFKHALFLPTITATERSVLASCVCPRQLLRPSGRSLLVHAASVAQQHYFNVTPSARPNTQSPPPTVRRSASSMPSHARACRCAALAHSALYSWAAAAAISRRTEMLSRRRYILETSCC